MRKRKLTEIDKATRDITRYEIDGCLVWVDAPIETAPEAVVRKLVKDKLREPRAEKKPEDLGPELPFEDDIPF